jgi:uncharacterized protein YhbP (UPF0306 family)
VPHASTFLYVNDGPTLYFWTKPGTTTATQIQQNPLVAFAVDSDVDDLRETKGVQGTGECSVVLSGEQIARVADLFGQRFPDLSPGTTMSISFFRIAPTELQFIDNTRSGSETEGETFGAEFHRERSYSVFDALPPVDTEEILASLQTMSASQGEVIVRAGGPADKFFVILEGEVEIVHPDDSGGPAVTKLGQGSFFGEMAIIRDTPRTATVKALTDVKLLALERDMFRDLVAQSLGTTADFDQVIRSRLGSPGAGA